MHEYRGRHRKMNERYREKHTYACAYVHKEICSSYTASSVYVHTRKCAAGGQPLCCGLLGVGSHGNGAPEWHTERAELQIFLCQACFCWTCQNILFWATLYIMLCHLRAHKKRSCSQSVMNGWQDPFIVLVRRTTAVCSLSFEKRTHECENKNEISTAVGVRYSA